MKEPTGVNLKRMRQYRRNIARAYPDAPLKIAEAERSNAIRQGIKWLLRRALTIFVLAAAFGLAFGLWLSMLGEASK